MPTARPVPPEVRRVAKKISTARERLAAAMEEAEQVARSANVAGMREADLERELPVNRTTVRKWLGK